MASGHIAVVYRQINRLFGGGTVAGLSEGQLLERFVARRDPDAFEAIVARHGPMVLSVCRSVLRDPNDVDDAFQAVFLVLVRKADALRHRDLLGGWLYGVAHRVARRARAQSVRRRDREAISPEPIDHVGSDTEMLDARPLIHEEVNRLPASYREAVILCYFQGRTHEEAAVELGWPIGTVKGRLARARDLLRDRLTRRGLAVPAALIASILAREGRAAILPSLIGSTTSLATAAASGSLATVLASAASFSPRALDLAQGVLQTMTLTKLKLAATMLVAAGVLSGPAVSAFQFGGAGSAKTNEPARGSNAEASSARQLAKEQWGIAESAVKNLQAQANAGAGSPTALVDILRWQRRLMAARIDAGTAPAEATAAFVKAAKDAESQIQQRHKAGRASLTEVEEIQFQRVDAERILAGFKDSPNAGSAGNPLSNAGGVGGMGMPGMGGMAGMGGMGGMGGGMGGMGAMGGGMGGMGGMGAGKSGMGGGMAGMGGGMGAMGGGMIGAGGGGLGGGALEDSGSPPRALPKVHLADVERNKLIEEALEKTVPLKFPKGTPLDEILKYIRENTRDPRVGLGKGILIYVDPIVLEKENAESAPPKSLVTRVPIEFEDIPLRVALRLILDQFSLGYQVRDRMVYVIDSDHLDFRSEGAREFLQSTGARSSFGGMGGGMGGMGGGMGGGVR